MSGPRIAKIADVPDLARDAMDDLGRALPRIRKLAASDGWTEREVAATVLVEVSRKKPDAVLEAMQAWARDRDPNIRRAASESMRSMARRDPMRVLPILEGLRADESLYVRKSVASMLRNASGKHPGFVLRVAQRWAKEFGPRTNRIIREGVKKLRRSHADEVAILLASLGS
ncbi:MAG: DNA alkylation repair protein [Thermoanaerobaculia bacterium]